MRTSGQPDPQQRILDIAEQVFAERGYRGGSLNEVAKRSGYTRAGVLHHFPSKEALLLALLDRRDERLHTYGDPGDQEEGFSEFLDGMPETVRRILDDRVLVQLAHALTSEASHPDHPAHEWTAKRHRALRTRSANAIRRSIDRGELPPDTDPDALAAVILGAVEGVEAQWLIDPDVDPERCARTLLSMLRALASRTP
ncbi:TetR/AcrR family transcriptional regulator [Streptomyces millisiae]|uniref:TetR/AcrR family transcriptional regulator n=1 Tax=Streptomyces millisiae TaxID=3075542 RepID=A0ABU2LWF9_9ACTN|nr:TetR/AcrR family transcriptional regulator [Streptomyces sp. DSM 44918]MDT0321941.1 TetR/AcrR family transcriptional regulator [Streptomyces sp. DSM 44918]